MKERVNLPSTKARNKMQKDKTFSQKKCLSLYDNLYIMDSQEIGKVVEINNEPTPVTTTDTNTETPTDTPKIDTDTKPSKPSDDGKAGERYHITRERERRIESEKKYQELLKKAEQKPPKFDDETDPDGSKEIEYKIQKGIDEGMSKYVEKLGLKDTLEKIQYEKELDKFNSQIDSKADKFKAIGIDLPTESERLKVLDTIEKHGITPEQLIAIAKLDQLLGKIRPATSIPGEGGKPNIERPLTQEEINARIYKKHQVFNN